MIYLEQKIVLPIKGTYTQTRKNKKGEITQRNLYFYTKYMRKGDKRLNKSVMIGRLEKDEATSDDYLLPNDKYYELVAKTNPPVSDLSQVSGPGRKPVRVKAASGCVEGEVFDYGINLITSELMKQTGLSACLEKVFDAEQIQKLKILIAFWSAEGYMPLNEIEDFQIRNHLWLADGGRLGDIDACQFMKTITASMMAEFYKIWIPKIATPGEIIYDVTSVSTYSANLLEAERGYNRDHEKLPQMNIGLVTTSSGCPVYVTSYNGSINDGTNFQYVLKSLQDFGLKPETMLAVLDRGFYQQYNLRFLENLKLDFVVGFSDKKIKAVKDEVVKWFAECTDKADFNHYYKIGGDSVFLWEREFKYAGCDGKLLIIYNEEQKAHLRAELLSQIQNYKEKLNAMEKMPESGNFPEYFVIKKCRGGKKWTYSIDDAAVRELIDSYGIAELFCSKKSLSAGEIIKIYRNRNIVETRFDELKNDMLGNRRMKVHSEEAWKGKLFILMLALIVRGEFSGRLTPWLDKKNLSVSQAYRKLQDLRLITLNGQVQLCKAITKEQREILKALGISSELLDKFVPSKKASTIQ